MCQLQVHRHWFQVKLHELYRFMILFVYLFPFFFLKTSKNQQKCLQIKENLQLSLTCVHFKLTDTDWGWNLSRWIDLWYYLFIYELLFFLWKRLESSKKREKSKKTSNCLSHVLISSWFALVPFHMWRIRSIWFINYSSGPMWRPENLPIAAKIGINDGKASIDCEVHGSQINQYRFQAQLNELYRLNELVVHLMASLLMRNSNGQEN